MVRDAGTSISSIGPADRNPIEQKNMPTSVGPATVIGPRCRRSCAGPRYNGADKAALRLARLGRLVKKMIGGVTGWLDEGFSLTPSP